MSWSGSLPARIFTNEARTSSYEECNVSKFAFISSNESTNLPNSDSLLKIGAFEECLVRSQKTCSLVARWGPDAHSMNRGFGEDECSANLIICTEFRPLYKTRAMENEDKLVHRKQWRIGTLPSRAKLPLNVEILRNPWGSAFGFHFGYLHPRTLWDECRSWRSNSHNCLTTTESGRNIFRFCPLLFLGVIST